MNLKKIMLMIFLALVLPGLSIAEKSSSASGLEKALKSEVKVRTDQAIQFLKDQQAKNGSWMNHPGITALCLQSFFTCPRSYNRLDGPFMRKPIDFLLSMQQKDGSFHDPKSRKPTKNYCTSLAVLALSVANDTTFEKNIQRGRDYLIHIQADEEEDYDPDKDYFYGGIGYGGDLRPDLSNLQLALDALHASGLEKTHPVYKRALIFINRCQNTESNDQKWAKSDGGFVYSPDLPSNKNLPTIKKDDDPMTAYGSMTFAGLKSLIFCNVKKDDPRVKAALKWITNNYSIDHHPGMGQVSLFYYYYTMARTLEIAGLEKLKLANGKTIHWRTDLAKSLLAKQNANGSWVNQEKKYMEGVPVLATAYALNALNIIYR